MQRPVPKKTAPFHVAARAQKLTHKRRVALFSRIEQHAQCKRPKNGTSNHHQVRAGWLAGSITLASVLLQLLFYRQNNTNCASWIVTACQWQ